MHSHRLLPLFIEQQIRAGSSAGSQTGAVLFVDIAGFSAMTDVLMQQGRHGAEVLASVIRTAFEPMMRAVYDQGGFVFSQEGDAFLAQFVAEAGLQE